MTIELRSWDGTVLFKTSKATTVGQAVIAAHQKNVSLYGLVHEGPIHIEEANLPGLQLIAAQLWSLEAEKANLTSASFFASHLTQADFTCANLAGADFGEALLRKVSFVGADLTDANFIDTEFVNVDFTNATFRRTRIDKKLTLTGSAKTIDTRLGQILICPNTSRREPYVQIGCTGYLWSAWQAMKINDLYEEFSSYPRELVRMFYHKWMPVVASMLS